jgi:hypothetical protein
MTMTKKTAKQKLEELKGFIPNAKKAIAQFENLKTKLETDDKFCKLWDSDSAEALRQVGINPEARVEMGLPPYSKGPECHNCITPQGNA